MISDFETYLHSRPWSLAFITHSTEKKLDGFHGLTTHGAYKSSPSSGNNSSHTSSSSIRWELGLIVREILGAETIVPGYRQRRGSSNSSTSIESNDMEQGAHSSTTATSKRVVGQHQPNKRKSPHHHHGLPSLDYSTLFHNPSLVPRSTSHSNSSGRRDKEEEADWEKVMWNCASVLSNSMPSPSFVASSQDRANRHRHRESFILGGEEVECKQGDEDANHPSTTPIFEGNSALATPGDIAEGGTGSGTAQHLACVLDSPLALAILLVMGVNVEARHTAFRRLAVHEAACADSPLCLGLLMEVGTRSYMELFGEAIDASVASSSSPSSSSVAYAAGESDLKSSSAVSTPTATATGLSVLDASSSSPQEKPGKKKVSLFAGLQKGKMPCTSFSMVKRTLLGGREKITEAKSFPVTLKVLWNAIQYLRSGQMNEVDAARYILERLEVSSKSMLTLALQCPHLPLAMEKSEEKTTYSFSLASIPGVSAANQLFRSNHRDMQSLFIKRNVDGHGNTPLHWAAFKDSVRAIDVLLSYNVDVNTRAQPSGWAPLHDAAYSDASNAVALLIAAGASVDARSHSGATPLCFAAQEDAPNATRMLLTAGADPSMRCLGNSPGLFIRANNADNHQFHSRFSGYTPLHYCAHYNAVNAARVLLYESKRYHHYSALELLEIPDLNEKLPIHVAVARGSSLVLREFLHSGARVETSSYHPPFSPRSRSGSRDVSASKGAASSPLSIPRDNVVNDETPISLLITSPHAITPVSSPILRAMIPSQPITSTKPWNCLSQTSIDACKQLIEEVEMNWTPSRHALFCPTDRQAIIELLRVGKRLEQAGRGIFIDLWPRVLSFCGRGWFEPQLDDDADGGTSLSQSLHCSVAELEEFAQFELDGTSSVL
jgi:ankyrin repeat protein